MSKVIQIRGVPDEVHSKLVEAAEAAGKSLTAFLSDELAALAARVDIVWHNAQVIADLRAGHGTAHLSRDEFLHNVDDSRAERDAQLDHTMRG